MTTPNKPKPDAQESKKKEPIKWKNAPSISILVAVAQNGTIGKDNTIPWRQKNDMKRFKEYTYKKVILVGINTFKSFPKLLKDRLTIVLTSDLGKVVAKVNEFKEQNPGVEVPPILHCASVSELEAIFDEIRSDYTDYDANELVVCGGEKVYKQFIDYMDKIVLTIIKANCVGDTVFPDLKLGGKTWKKLEEVSHFKDDNNEYDYKFFTFERVKQAKVIDFKTRVEISKLDRISSDQKIDQKKTEVKEGK